ncbi:MAG: hypothetical protein Kow0013_25360 [Pararhodobacter sp.]
MIIIAGLLIGVILGLRYARQHGGTGLDLAQYGAVWGIIGTLIGVVLTVGIEKLL